MPHHFSVNDLPRRLTLMQAVAWIATRDPVVVLRSSLDERECARAIVHLGDDDEWCGTAKGISLHAIDLRCGAAGAGQSAIAELIQALRNGKINALGSYFFQEDGWGEARPIPAAEWDSIVLETDAGNDRKLVHCHCRDDGGMVAAPVENWRVIGIEAVTMARVWPAAQPPLQEENLTALAGIEPATEWPNLPTSEDGKHVALPDEYYIPAKTAFVWVARRHDANRAMDLGTALKAIGELTPKLESGKLNAFLFDADDAAKEPQKVRVDLFSRGMALHHSGWLTKAGNVSMDEYAALGRVPVGPVRFLRAELLSLWPRATNNHGGWPTKTPADNRPMQEREHIGFREIADACARPPGDVVPEQRRRDEALNRLVDYFKNGGFREAGKSVVVARANKGQYDDPTMSFQDFDQSLGIARGDIAHRCKLLEDLELPRAYALRFFLTHDLPLPAFWFSEAEIAAAKSAHSAHNAGQAIAASSAARRRPKPTSEAVKRWQRERVETWPDDKPAPAEHADWTAVSAHFGDGLRRDDYRPIREAETPIEWRTRGKRKPWGVVKVALAETAEKSANLRPQK